MAEYTDPNAAPGPVGFGPGFWRWDAWGGQWRNDWKQADNGGWLLSGENGQGAQAGANSAAAPNFQRNPGGHQATSPHFNPALAAQYLKDHPNAWQMPAEGQLTGDYNPDIWDLVHGKGNAAALNQAAQIAANRGSGFQGNQADPVAGGQLPPGAAEQAAPPPFGGAFPATPGGSIDVGQMSYSGPDFVKMLNSKLGQFQAAQNGNINNLVKKVLLGRTPQIHVPLPVLKRARFGRGSMLP